MRRWMIAAVCLVAGCVADTSEGDGSETADGIDDSFSMGDAADGFGITETDPRACAVLRLANEAPQEELGLLPYTRTAAQYVIEHRAGPDRRAGTTDDDRIQSLVELDAIPYVGPTAFNKWLGYIAGTDWERGCTTDRTVDTPWGAKPPEQACAILRASNVATLDQLDVEAGLDGRAARGIVAARPIESLEELDAIPYVGVSAIDGILGRLAAHPEWSCSAPMPTGCTATGGTYDGVAFTREEECRAVAMMNRARFSQLGSLTATVRRTIWFEVPIGTVHPAPGHRGALWQSVAQLEPMTGPAGMTSVRTVSRTWVDDGVSRDTVAFTVAHRAEMAGAPLLFDKIYVERLRSVGHSAFCYDVRDRAGAPDVMTACVFYVNADSAPACSSQDCLDRWIGRSTQLRASLYWNGTPTGYSIHVAHEEPTDPDPRIP